MSSKENEQNPTVVSADKVVNELVDEIIVDVKEKPTKVQLQNEEKDGLLSDGRIDKDRKLPQGKVYTSTVSSSNDTLGKPKAKSKNFTSKNSRSKKSKKPEKGQTKLELVESPTIKVSEDNTESISSESMGKTLIECLLPSERTSPTNSNSGTTAKKGDKDSSKEEKIKKKGKQSTRMTDFFPVRRSDRRSKAELEKLEKSRLEEKILSGCEDGLKVIDIEGKGRGVISTKTFRRGDFIVEYAGDLISLTEAQSKESQYSENPDIGCYMYYFKFDNKNYCIDATAESGKLGRLLNHSKNGNCKTKVVGIEGRPYLILVAATDIDKNVELLYDYGDRSKEALEAHPWLAF